MDHRAARGKSRGKRPWLLLACVLLAACGALDVAPGRDSVTVPALWVAADPDIATQPEGRGTTDVAVTTSHSGAGDGLQVDLDGFRDAGTGPMWQASAWAGTAVAIASSGQDPRGRSVRFDISEAIEGPSASALLALGVQSITGQGELAPDASMTGMIMPNGAIGAVSGIVSKMRAADEAGLSAVLIPAGIRRDVDPRTGSSVDVVEFGRSLGLDVFPVATLAEAAAIMGGTPLPVSTYARPAIDPALTRMLRRETRQTLRAVRQSRTNLAATTSPAWKREQARLRSESAATIASVPRLLVRGDVFYAYSEAAEVDKEIRQFNARATVLAGDWGEDPQQVRRSLAKQARQLRRSAADSVDRYAGTALRYVEQYPALATALTWAVDASSALRQIRADLARSSDTDQLAELAGELAAIEVDLTETLPVHVRAVDRVGAGTTSDATQTLSLLAGYADLVGQTAEAIMDYGDSLQIEGEVDPALRDFARRQQQVWQAGVQHGDDQQGVLLGLARSLNYYAAASWLFTLGPILTGPDAAGHEFLLDANYFQEQVTIATGENHRIAQTVADSGLDASYLVWSNEWGLALADGAAAVAVTAEVRAQGLVHQWMAAIQGYLLTALRDTTDVRTAID